MAITLTPGAQIRRGGVFQSAETLTGATTSQAISLLTDVTELGACTATQGNFSLAAGIEGQEKFIVQTGTGTLNKITPAAFANGWTAILLSATDHFAGVKYVNGKWVLTHSHFHRAAVSAVTTATAWTAALTAMVT